MDFKFCLVRIWNTVFGSSSDLAWFPAHWMEGAGGLSLYALQVFWMQFVECTEK